MVTDFRDCNLVLRKWKDFMKHTRYNSFDKFMLDVVESVNNQHDLYLLFKLNSKEVVAITQKILEAGWWLFLAVVGLLILSPLAFAISLGAFLLTPIGVILLSVLGGGASFLLKTLHQNKILLLAIKEIGQEYQNSYEKIQRDYKEVEQKYTDSNFSFLKNTETKKLYEDRNEKIDRLFYQAAIALKNKSNSLNNN